MAYFMVAEVALCEHSDLLKKIGIVMPALEEENSESLPYRVCLELFDKNNYFI